MTVSMRVLRHDGLAPSDVRSIAELFDAEYLDEHGPSDLDRPYGYAPADAHVIAVEDDAVVGHVGFQRREITVGGTPILIGGTGGVLVADAARGSGVGGRLLRRAQEEMRRAGLAFGYLGCRPAVVPFYESAGWTRIQVRERSVSRLDPNRVEMTDDSPILICPAARPVVAWPDGEVDLRGVPW